MEMMAICHHEDLSFVLHFHSGSVAWWLCYSFLRIEPTYNTECITSISISSDLVTYTMWKIFLYDIFGLVWRLRSSQKFSSWFFKSSSFLWGRRQNYFAHESVKMHRTLFSEIVILEFRITLACLFLSV